MIGSEVLVADEAFSRIPAAQLEAAGFTGVVRYVLGAGKALSKVELSGDLAAGLAVAVVHEDGNEQALAGRTVGTDRARAVNQALDDIGFPRDRPVIVVAEDPTPLARWQWLIAADYFRGWADYGVRERWAYGSGAIITYLCDLGLATGGWEVSSWPGAGSKYSRLRQMANGVAGRSTFGGAIDHNIVLAPDGDWGQTPAPPRAPTGVTKMTPDKVDIMFTPSGLGYWEVASDGGVFSRGDAQFLGSLGNVKLAAPIVAGASLPRGAVASDPLRQGYWLAAADGGVFAFGVPFLGSVANVKLDAPVDAIRVTPTGQGYVLLGKDGGVFTFGDAHFEGAG